MVSISYRSERLLGHEHARTALGSRWELGMSLREQSRTHHPHSLALTYLYRYLCISV